MGVTSEKLSSLFMYFSIFLQTEFVAEQEHEHSVTSRINLVDLAGSERCFTSQTSGNRLKVNAFPALFSSKDSYLSE